MTVLSSLTQLQLMSSGCPLDQVTPRCLPGDFLRLVLAAMTGVTARAFPFAPAAGDRVLSCMTMSKSKARAALPCIISPHRTTEVVNTEVAVLGGEAQARMMTIGEMPRPLTLRRTVALMIEWVAPPSL